MKRIRHTAAFLCLVATAAMAADQVGLPQLPVPLPPLPNVPGTVNDTLRTAQSVTPLADLRKLRVRELLRSNRGTIETDPQGQPILRRQIGALSPTGEALAKAKDAGFRILAEHALGNLGLRLVILEVPEGMSTRSALRRMRKLDPDGSYDYHHLYLESGASFETLPDAAAPPAEAPPVAAGGARVGLIDSGVDGAHPALAGLRIHRFGCDGATLPAVHGTAVASLLAGDATGFRGVLPGAELYAADVFCGKGGGS